MFRGYLQYPGSMFHDKFFEIRSGSLVHISRVIEEKIVPDTAANVEMPYALHCRYGGIQLQQPCVGPVQIPARRREQAGLADAPGTQFPIPALHAVHIGCRSPYIGDITGKTRDILQGSHFLQDGFLGT